VRRELERWTDLQKRFGPEHALLERVLDDDARPGAKLSAYASAT
jgi:hypothetical protein